MPDDELPPDEGPVTDPQELERVMLLAAGDVALHGPFFRLLIEARVWIFVPPHPELVSLRAIRRSRSYGRSFRMHRGGSRRCSRVTARRNSGRRICRRRCR